MAQNESESAPTGDDNQKLGTSEQASSDGNQTVTPNPPQPETPPVQSPPQTPPQTPPPVSPKDMVMTGSTPEGIQKMLAAVVNLSAGGTYHEPSCPFCCSRNRADAERLWNSMDFMTQDAEDRVSEFFRSAGETVSPDAVRNHVQAHMKRGDAELRKVEYLSKIANLCDVNMTTLEQIKMGRAVVMECLAASGEIVPNKKLSPAKANEMRADIVSKLLRTWTNLMMMEGKITGELEMRGEVIRLPRKAFFEMFDQLLTSAETSHDRQLIHGILTKLTSLLHE